MSKVLSIRVNKNLHGHLTGKQYVNMSKNHGLITGILATILVTSTLAITGILYYYFAFEYQKEKEFSLRKS